MLQQNIRWQTLEDPLVSETLLWRESLGGIPLKTHGNEVNEGIIRNIPQLYHDVL